MTQQPTLGWILKGRSLLFNCICWYPSGSTSKQAMGTQGAQRAPHFSTSIQFIRGKGDFRPPPLDRYQAHIPQPALLSVLIRFQRARRCCPDFQEAILWMLTWEEKCEKVKEMCKKEYTEWYEWWKRTCHCLGGQCHGAAEPTKNLNTLQTSRS